MGSGRLPHQPGQASTGAAGCTEGHEPLGPCVSALEPPSSRDPWGPTCRSPFLACSLCAAMFSAAKLGPRPLLILFGGGAGFLLPHAFSPQPGNSGYQVPCVEPSFLPGFPRPGPPSGQLWNGLQVAAVQAAGEGTSLPTSFFGTDMSVTSLPRRGEDPYHLGGSRALPSRAPGSSFSGLSSS